MMPEDPQTPGAHTNESISTKVVAAVAEANGVDPIELDEPLYEVVDPDALDALFRSRADGSRLPYGRVTFSMAGCEVVVDSEGHVVATPMTVNDRSPASEGSTAQ